MSSDEQETPQTPALPPRDAVGIPVVKSTVVDENAWGEEDEAPAATVSAPVEPEPPLLASEPPAGIPEDAPAAEGTSATADVDAVHEKTPEAPVEHLLFDVAPNTLNIDPSRPIYLRLTEEQVGAAALALLPTTIADLNTFEQSAVEATNDDMPWLLAIGQATETGYPGHGLFDAARRKDARWKNMLENKDGTVPLGDHRDGYKMFDQPATRISGNDAVEMFMAGTNLGRPVTVPLWHSGFWMKFRAPSAAYLAEIDRALAFSREELGLEIFGAIGANDRVIFDEILVDAALKLVVETNAPLSKNPLELKEFISAFDIDTIIWAMAQAAFPDGCQIAIPCPNCKHVSNVKANLTRMRFVDESRVTEKQIRHMSKGISHKLKFDEIHTYQEEFKILNGQSWTWKGRNFYFQTPTIEQYLTSGREYITSVSRALQETLREDFTDDYRRGQSTKSILETEEACRFVHYIREIKIPQSNKKGSEENYGVVNDGATILQILRSLSGEYEAASSFILAVNDYINDAINTIVGFPNVNCPNCNKYYLSTSGAETVIVPFNPAVGFFTLAQHKISEAGTEPLTNLTTLGVTALLSRASGLGQQG